MAFEDKFFAGELTPTLKSEEPADEDLAEPVKVVKGKSFSSMVLENGEFERDRHTMLSSIFGRNLWEIWEIWPPVDITQLASLALWFDSFVTLSKQPRLNAPLCFQVFFFFECWLGPTWWFRG